MADIQSDIKVNIDTSSALASIKNLQRQISTFQLAMSKGSAANSAAGQNLQKDLLQNINATGRFAASMTNVRTTTESFTNSLEKNKFSLGEYVRFGAGATKRFGKFFKGEFETINKVARERVKDLQTQYIQLGRDANGAMRGMKVRPLTLDLNDLGTKTAMMSQRQQIFNQLLKQGSTNLLNFGKNTQWAGRQLMMGFTLPLALFGASASKTFMDLEKQAIRFKRVYGDAFSTPEGVEQAVKDVKELASEFTKYGVAIEATMELAADAAQMGLTGAALSAQIREATRLAVLGEVSQQEALKTSISITNAFGIAAEDLAKKIDFLNAVENETVTAISDLTIAIPKAAPVVRQLGGDIEDLAFFLTAMKEGGINASEGANALKSGLASLINPTKVSSEFLQKLGINIKGIVEANAGDVKGTVIEFAEALDALDPLNRARAIEQLFGKFQFSRISTLFQNVISEGNQAQKVLALANASTSELATISERELGKVADSATFKYEKAIQDFRMSLAPVGEEFLKAVTPIIEFGTSLIKQFNNMDAGVKGFVTNTTLLFAGIGPVLIMSIGLVANAIANLIKGVGLISQFFQRIKGGPTSLGSEIGYMTQEQLEAVTVAASLDQVHSKLQQTFTSERAAIDQLTASYRRAVEAQRSFGVPPTIRGVSNIIPNAFASGTVNVPGPRGAGDVVPAMLSPGEAVIPAKQAQEYRGFIESMIAGNVPGFMFGRNPLSSMFGGSRVATRMPGQSFIQSLRSGNTQYQSGFATGSGDDFFGQYGTPKRGQAALRGRMEQSFLGMPPQTQPGQRPTFGFATSPAIQRVLSFIMGGSGARAAGVMNPLSKSLNRFGDISLITNKGVASRSTMYAGDSLLDYSRSSHMGSPAPMVGASQAQLSSAKFGRFAEPFGTSQVGPNQFHVNPKPPFIETQTPGGFSFNEIERIVTTDVALANQLRAELVSAGMPHIKVGTPGFIQRMMMSLGVPGFADGVVSVPGPKGAGDVMPAMLSPGEAVIPTAMAKKYGPLINAMVSGNIPGFEGGVGVSGSIASAASMAKQYSDLQVMIPNIFSILETAILRIEQSGKRLSQAGIDREIEQLVGPLVKLARSTSAGGASASGSGASVSGANLAHGAPMVKLPKEIARELGLELQRQGVNNAASKTLAGATKDVNAFSNMVFPMPRSFNSANLSGSEASSFIKKDPQMFTSVIADMYKVDRNDPELRQFANSVANGLELAGSKAITDGEFYDVIFKSMKRMTTSAAKDALQSSSTDLATVGHRSNSGKDRREPLYFGKSISAAIPERMSGQTSTVATDASLAEAKSYVQFRGSKSGKEIMQSANLLADDFVIQLVKAISQRFASSNDINKLGKTVFDEVSQGLGINSPSKEYEKISNSVTAGVRQATDDAAAAGQEIGMAAAKNVAAVADAPPGVFKVSGSRRATTNPALAPMPTGTQTGGSRRPRRAMAPQQAAGASGQTGVMATDGAIIEVGASSAIASSQIKSLGENAKKGGIGLLGYGGIVSNLTFAGSALAGVMSSMGGVVGEFGQHLFTITGTLFAATSVIQAFTQMKVLELAASRAKLASDVAFGAAIGPKTLAQSATGFLGGLAKGAKFVTAFLGPIGLATLAIGALVAGIYLVNKAREEEKARIEGLGKVANLAAEKIADLAAIFGITTAASPLATATLTPGISGVEAAQANEVRLSEAFAEDYSAELKAIRTGAQKDVELALQFLSVKLSGTGFESEMIDTIVNALLIESGRTDLQLNFKAIDFSSASAVKEAVQAAATAAAAFNTATAAGVKKSTDVRFDRKGKRFQDDTPTPIFTEEQGTKLNTLSEGLASTVFGLSAAFANSTIDVKEFETGLLGVEEAIARIEDETARGEAFDAFLEGMRTETNTTFIDELKKLAPTADGIANSMLLIKALASGLELPKGIAEAFAAVSANTATSEQIAAVAEAQRAYNVELTDTLNTQKQTNDTNALDIARNAVTAEIATLEENIQTKKDFEEAGLDAAEASQAFGDSILSAALSAAFATKDLKIIKEVVEDVKTALKLQDEFQGGTAGGGAPQKGPYEDLLTSLKSVADKSIKVKGGIDEIFKLFGKNRNIGLNKGFESLFVKGNFNASFAKFLADAEAKTRDLLVRFKNGKAILTDFGLAAQKAFEANSLAAFRQSLRMSIQETENKRAAIKALTKNNIGYAEAVAIASDADRAASIASAANNKDKGVLVKLLRLLKTEQKALLVLQGEQEIEDKKQSKIQEAKEMVEGIREQIREFNKLSKAQEQLSKSNFTVIEQQAILRDPVLITMFLDGIEPELLKAKLKEVINPEFIQGIVEEGLNKAMETFDANEQKLDIELRIKTSKDEEIVKKASRAIAAISFEIDDLQADLTRLESKEEEISSIYDKRIDALEAIKSINDDLVDQQGKQLTIADALSQGDISAAAKAVQDLRASQAARSIDLQKEALEKSRESELGALRSANGKSRVEIEKIIKNLQTEIFEIEEARLEPAQRLIELATEEKEDLVASFLVLGKTKLEWEGVSSNITLAKVESDLYKDSISQSIKLVGELATAWSTVKPINPVIPFSETLDSAAVTAAQDAAAKEAAAKKAKGKKNKTKLATTIEAVTPGLRKLTEQEIEINRQREAADRLRSKAMLEAKNIDKEKASRAEKLLKLIPSIIKPRLAVGGFVSGPGTPTSDSIPAMLSDGEYVIKAASVNKFGQGFLDNINDGQLPGFKKGGPAKPQYFAAGGMVKLPSPEPAPTQMSVGGMVKKYAAGGIAKGYARGGDVVPAMLTPGEFVMSKYAVDSFGSDNLKAINNGAYSSDSVYNYSINVNVQTDANANDIARNVMTEIRRIDSQKIRGNRF